MKKVTFILVLALLMSVNFDSSAAYSSISASSSLGTPQLNQKTVTLPSGVYGTYKLYANADIVVPGTYATSYAKITGTNFSKYCGAFVENTDYDGHYFVLDEGDSDTRSGTVGSSASSLTYTIIAYAKATGYSTASSSASVTW